MGYYLDHRDHQKIKFWYLPHLDPSDLAVAVAGDICEGFVEPWDYLQFYPDWDRLNRIRQCLRMGLHIEDIYDISNEHLVDAIDSILVQLHPEHIVGDPRSRDFYLKVCFFFPFAMCNQDTCLYVDHTTMDYYPKDKEELKEALMNHFNFYRFDRWMFNHLPGPVQY